MTNSIQILIQAVERADSADGLLEAVEALAAACQEAAIPTLITVLGYNNPGAAVAAVDGLVELGEAVVPSLLEQIDGYNYGARAWAIRALAGIGNPRALKILLEAASTDFSLSVRRAAAKGLGTIRWSQLSDEQVRAAQAEVLKTLLLVSQDPEWVVRYAVIVGLQALGSAVSATQPETIEKILDRLGQMAEIDLDLAVRARAQMAIEQLKDLELSEAEANCHEATHTAEINWRTTLEELYVRKYQERQLPKAEGDPRQYHDMVTALNIEVSQ